MISALRKIEGRGELQGATSAVMEMCIDNPREGFADLFATHPSIDKRVEALVKFAGGHDPGPLAIAAPETNPLRSPAIRRPADRGLAAPQAKAPSRSCRACRRSVAMAHGGPKRATSPRAGSRDGLMPLERNQRAHRHVELAQLVGAAEVRQVDDEAGGEHIGAHLAQAA